MIDAETSSRATVRRFRIAAGWFAFGTAVMVVSIALAALARHELRQQLAGDTAMDLAALDRGESRLAWPLRTPRDVIAGRAFGTDDFRFDDHGMHLRSTGEPVEIGVVVRGVLDLQRYPMLHADVRAATALSIIVRESLDAPICEGMLRDATVLLGGGDLTALGWRCEGQPANAPTRAAMLRLRVQAPAGIEVGVRDVALHPRVAIDIGSVIPHSMVATADTTAATALARRLSSHDDVFPAWTLGVGDARVERVLATRDAIRSVEPAALVVMDGDWSGVVAHSRESTARPRASTPVAVWTGVAVCVIALLALRLRPPRSTRLRATGELVGVLAVPLAFVLGSGLGDDVGTPWWVALGATLIFAASLLFGEAPPPLVAGGARRKGWLVAGASVLGTLALALALRDTSHAPAWPSPARIARYLAWASVQQVLICVIVSTLAERMLRSALPALLLAATSFALLHTPNAMLMQLTFAGGLIWVWNWQRHRALLANIVAHAASGLLLAATLPIDWLRSAEVGARYFLF